MNSDFQHKMQQTQPEQRDLVALEERMTIYTNTMVESIFTELERLLDQRFAGIRYDIGIHKQTERENGFMNSVRRLFKPVSLVWALLCCGGVSVTDFALTKDLRRATTRKPNRDSDRQL
jgi:hypothetical protein